MRKFSQFLVEANFLKELEEKMLTININQFKNIDNSKQLKIFEQPEWKIFDEENKTGDHYTVGSLYDIVRNYRPSKNIISYIKDKFPFSIDYEKEISKELKFTANGNQHTLTLIVPLEKWIKFYGILDPLQYRKYDAQKILNYAGNTIKVDNKWVFNPNTFRTKNGITPDKTPQNFSKEDLQEMVKSILSPIEKSVMGYEHFVYNVAIKLEMEVLTKYYNKNTTSSIDSIKQELLDTKNVNTYRDILKRNGFENLPDENILKGLFKSKPYFQYSIEYNEGRYKTGTTWTINFSRKSVESQGWSSDD